MSVATGKDILVRWRLIIGLVIIFALVFMIVSLVLPTKYQSDITMIVIQERSTETGEAFGMIRSTEYMSDILAEEIYSTSFFNAIQDAPFDVERDFSQSSEERENKWRDMTDVRRVDGTSIIKISVANISRKTAEETVKAIAYTLTMNTEEYYDGSGGIEIQLMDGPNTPLRPTLPNIFYNTTFGGLFGMVVAVIFIFFFPNKLCITKNDYR